MRLFSASALQVFDAAARHGSFKLAAVELGVSPTAVSHRIRALEARLGFALFVRGTRIIELTDAGRRLAGTTADAFQRIGDTLEGLDAVERRLTVSTTPAFGALWLAPRLTAFETRNPDVEVRIETSTAVVDLARDRRIDLAIRYGKGEHPGLDTVRLMTENIAAFGSPEYLDRLPGFPQATLIATDWVSDRLPDIGWELWAARAAVDEVGRVRMFDQEQQAIQAGLAGQGLVLASSVLVADMLRRGWLRAYQPDIVLEGLTYAAVTTPQHAQTGKVRRFLAWLREEAGRQDTARRPVAGAG